MAWRAGRRHLDGIMTASFSDAVDHAGARRPLLIGIAYGLTVIATTGIIGGTVLVATRDELLRNELEFLKASARTAAAIVDAESVAAVARSGQEPSREYAAAVRPLFVLDSVDESIVHVTAAVVRGDSMRIVLDAAPPGAKRPDGLAAHEGAGAMEPATPEAKLAWAARKAAFVSEKPSRTPWGDGLQASAPVLGHDGRIVAVVNLTSRSTATTARSGAWTRSSSSAARWGSCSDGSRGSRRTAWSARGARRRRS